MVGTPYAKRNMPELQQLAGCLVNTVALRCSINGDPTFPDLLKHVSKSAMQAFSHADAPFAQVVQAVHQPRSASFTPIYQVQFTKHQQLSLTFSTQQLTLQSAYQAPKQVVSFIHTLTFSREHNLNCASCIQVLLMLEDEGDYASSPAEMQAGGGSVNWLPLAVGGDTATTPTDLDFRLRSSR